MSEPSHRPVDVLPRLYGITDRACAARGVGTTADAVEAALEGGLTMLQFRDKERSDARVWSLAKRIRRVCAGTGVRLLVNARADIASLLDADGVHRPSDGLPVDILRRVLDGGLVGASCHDHEELTDAEQAGADFATLSPVFPTDSKPGYGPPLGLRQFSELASSVDIPVYALGGITPDRAEDCLEAGAHGVAAMSGIMAADAPKRAVERYLQALDS
ncbi:MAG: thiamine phosphate synthase [Bradymonadaceae bacterium]